MLRQYGIEIIERLLYYDSLSLVLLWTFVRAFGILFVMFSKHRNYNVNFELNQDLGLLIVFVDAR